MAENITRAKLAERGNTLLVARCKTGVVWGSDNYPANSLPAWFAGAVSVPQVNSIVAGDFTAGNASASQAITALRSFANAFQGVRRTRIIIRRSHYSLGSVLLSDATNVANTTSNVGNFADSLLTSITNNTNMTLAVVDQTCNAFYNAYVASCRNTTITLTRTVCHTSCHSNCHCARGRR